MVEISKIVATRTLSRTQIPHLRNERSGDHYGQVCGFKLEDEDEDEAEATIKGVHYCTRERDMCYYSSEGILLMIILPQLVALVVVWLNQKAFCN